jgi:hypothetical protein
MARGEDIVKGLAAAGFQIFDVLWRFPPVSQGEEPIAEWPS